MKIKAVIFDLDGTLIDSSKAIIDSLFSASKFYNLKTAIQPEQSYLFMGKSLKETVNIMIPNASNEDKHKVAKYYVEHYYEFKIKDAELFPHVEKVIKELHAKGLKLGVATAKETFCAKGELEATNIAKYFESIRGTDKGIPSKPNPQLLFELCKTFNVTTDEIVMVGDTDRDVLFGKNAGCKTCVVLHGTWHKERFIEENIIPDFFAEDFNSVYDYLRVLF